MKKLFYGLGAVAAVVTPVVAVVSCGTNNVKKGAENTIDTVKNAGEKAVDAVRNLVDNSKDADYLAWYKERMEDSKNWDALAKAELDLEAQEAAAVQTQQLVVAEQPKVELTVEEKFEATLNKAIDYIKANYKRENIAFEPGIGFKINIKALDDANITVAFSYDPTVDPVMQWRSKMGAGAIKDLFESSNHEINFSNMKNDELEAITAEQIADEKDKTIHEEVNNHRNNTLEYWLSEIKMVMNKIDDIAYVSLEDAIDAQSSIEVSTVDNWSNSLPAIATFQIL